MSKPTSDCRATERNHPWPMVRLGDVCEVLDSRRVPISKKDRVGGNVPYYGATGVVDYVNDFIFDERLVLLGEDGAKWGAGDKSAFVIEGKSWVNNHVHVLRPKLALVDSFLVWYLNYADLGEYITGVTVPKLNQQRMGQIALPLPPLSEQKEIVARLERELAAVEKMKKGFEALAETAKAEFKAELKEVFEELKSGAVEMRRLGDVCELKAGGDKPTTFSKCATDTMRIPVVSNGIQNDGICGYTDVATDHAGCVTVSARGTIGWSCIRDYSFVPIVRLIVIRPKDNVDVGYLLRMLQQLSFNQSGSSIPQLTVPMLKGVEIPLPSLPVQRQIVDRLSAAKARAEKLEAKAQEGVAVCETMRKAILKEAFDSGR